jgi:hypothetical protein
MQDLRWEPKKQSQKIRNKTNNKNNINNNNSNNNNTCERTTQALVQLRTGRLCQKLRGRGRGGREVRVPGS